jgi:hypothetical protein
MPLFTKKPVTIEARQFVDKSSFPDLIQWIGINASHNGLDLLFVTTLEGVMAANQGDWIIKGVKGEFYPCKPDIFEATYNRCVE